MKPTTSAVATKIRCDLKDKTCARIILGTAMNDGHFDIFRSVLAAMVRANGGIERFSKLSKISKTNLKLVIGNGKMRLPVFLDVVGRINRQCGVGPRGRQASAF